MPEWLVRGLASHGIAAVVMGPEALKPARESALRVWKVWPRMNRTGEGSDDPTIIAPLVMDEFEKGTGGSAG
jgi:hypothetical protein